MKISLGLVFVLILLQACSLTDVTSFFWDSDKENTNIPELNQDRQDWKDKLSWPPECNQDEANFYNEESGVKVYNLSENKSIVLVSCFLGSYQDNYRLYLYTEGQDQPVKNLVLESKTQKDSQDPKRVDLDSFSSTETYENFVETG
ncbi:hypothetical protein KKC60_00060, partial [Patescibacteria group bacterium]|nr:hypothetical protein [Patescibacteria group bacterium]